MSENKDTAVPRFFMQAVENKARSIEEGRPIFDEIEMVEIRIPGDNKTVFVDRVFRKDGTPNGAGLMNKPPAYIERWPRHYDNFKAKQPAALIGTPLSEWPPMTVSKVAEFRALGIHTVENLADLTDGHLSKLGMGGREWREKARAYIQDAKAGSAAAENAALQAQLDAMQAQIMMLMGGPPQGPGAVAVEAEPTDKSLDECSDAELKAYIKSVTGEAPRGNPSRDTLLERAMELATKSSEAA